MNHEECQGVVAIRQGEQRQYYEFSHGQPTGNFVYLVALVQVPLPPEPRSEKTEGITVVCAGKSGKTEQWGWLSLEKDTKQLIAEDLVDLLKAKFSEWFWLKLFIESGS